MTQETTAGTELRDFVKFSAAVTGFSEFDLWGTGQAEAYHRTAVDQVGQESLRAALASDPSAAPADPVVASIIKLWYVGVWYGPEQVGRTDVAAWTAPGRSGAKPAVAEGGRAAEDPSAPPFVVSPDAYTEGLLWRAIGAHPSGAKAPGYGSWATPPAVEDHQETEVR
ncbi:hypothetical protein [Streptomyces galbus]|uniref:Uncharacterized protein n=1 Tax=Streptomyces galbus TaxID=33898 RepID=A0A4V6AXL0_STRGB|nr:hypothetical protein [Streptomyces galbus]TKS98112.1 hypothetical protein E4U92_31185 [Streptomyces galbus]GHD43832.1 hypothetical protein GCM10010335_47860 [Streptomyces galbus]